MLTDEDINRHLSAMIDAEVIAVDTEATGLHVKDGRDYGMGISVAYYLGGLGVMDAYFPFRHADKSLDPSVLARLKPILESKPLIFHNVKYDLFVLATFGIYPSKDQQIFCTQQLAHLVNEEWYSKALDALSRMLLNDQKEKDDLEKWTHAFGWLSVPADLMDAYARHDANLTLRLFAEHLWPRANEQGLTELWPREMRFLHLLRKIEEQGLLVNQDFAKVKVSVGKTRMQDICDELGFDPTPTNLIKLFFTDLKLPILAWTGGKEGVGRPSLTKKEMEQYDEMLAVSDDRRARLVLEYRGWQKSVSSLYQSVLDLISPDGRIRPNFKAHGTKTGRLSCELPNLQQIPRQSVNAWNGDAKEVFIHTPGFTLLEFDYSQLEFRLAAAYGKEEQLIEIFNTGQDPFIPTAVEVFGGPEHRQSAKTLTYATLYGAGQRRISFALGVSEIDASHIVSRFRELYPGIYTASATATQLAAKRGYVRYWTGRRRHFPNAEVTYKAFNSIIQGGGFEIVKDALIRVDNELCNDDCRIVLTVHDSIVLEVRDELVEQIKPKVIAIMSDFPQFGVKFDVECKVWGQK